MTDDLIDSDNPRLIELPSPFELEPGTLRLLEPADGNVDKQLSRLRDGALRRPFMIDNGLTRSLFFSIDNVQSCMRLDDPLALVAAYTQKMMAFLLFIPAPRHVLMIGLGGGSLAKFCHRFLPDTRISVVEINADVIALRDEFGIPPDDERFEIIHKDGADFLSKAEVIADVILIDAFDEEGVSRSLASSDFYRRANECLTPDGALIMNLSGDKSRYLAPIQNLRSVFPAVLAVPVEDNDNVLLFAFRRLQLLRLPDCLQARAVELEIKLGLAFSRFLERLRAGHVLGLEDLGTT
jgi:spermidine synthase